MPFWVVNTGWHIFKEICSSSEGFMLDRQETRMAFLRRLSVICKLNHHTKSILRVAIVVPLAIWGGFLRKPIRADLSLDTRLQPSVGLATLDESLWSVKLSLLVYLFQGYSLQWMTGLPIILMPGSFFIMTVEYCTG
jgi:hypothetical protein